jgi:predicted AlkP superfamily phosphohydrolase/phosphomutase
MGVVPIKRKTDFMQVEKKKVTILGLDGGTWTILKNLINEGKAPFFRQLCRNGAHGVLKSITPPVTAPAWTSFLTGQNPGKHGIFDFQWIDFAENKRKLTFSADCKSANLMDYLDYAGRRSLFMNVPLTFPPRPVNGVLIAGFPVPPHSDFVYPPSLQEEIRKQNYITDWMEIYKSKKSLSKANMIRMADKSQIDIFASMLTQDNWDLAMIVVSGTDHIAHLEWQKGNVKGVKDYYAYVDGMLSELHARGVFQDSSIVVMSDHGFGGASHAFFMNTWLNKEGYLNFKAERQETYDVFLRDFRKTVYGSRQGLLSRLLKAIGLTRENLIYLGKKTGLIRLEAFLPHSVISVFPSHEFSIDWSTTKAYMVSNASKGININLQGREHSGIVSSGEYDELRKEIVGKLRALRANAGNPLMHTADLKENIYSGPYVQNAPDVVTWPTPDYKIRMGTNQKTFIRRVIEAQHTLDGIYVFSGDEFLQDGFARELSIMDIVPTVLHLMDLPVPDDMDGRVAADLFASDSSAGKRSVRFMEPLHAIAQAATASPDDETIAEKLKALGYL